MVDIFDLSKPRSFWGVFAAAIRFLFIECWRFFIVIFLVIFSIKILFSIFSTYRIYYEPDFSSHPLIEATNTKIRYVVLFLTYLICYYFSHLQIAYWQSQQDNSIVSFKFVSETRTLFWLLPFFGVITMLGCATILVILGLLLGVDVSSKRPLFAVIVSIGGSIGLMHFNYMGQIVLTTNEKLKSVSQIAWQFLADSPGRTFGYMAIFVGLGFIDYQLLDHYNRNSTIFIDEFPQYFDNYFNFCLSLKRNPETAFSFFMSKFFSIFLFFIAIFHFTVFAIETRRHLQGLFPEQPDLIDEIGKHLES